MGWSEIVTTALLGTGRRPVPEDLPAWAGSVERAPDAQGSAERGSPESRVLDLAAAHRVAAQAGRPPEPGSRGPGATAVPAQRLPFAPVEADRLLAAYLTAGDSAATTRWLGVCARHRRGARPEHWARLAGLASRSPTYDRGALASVLGDRGRWFVRQNPDWAKLATLLDASDRAVADPTREPGPSPDPDQVRKDPELLLAVPDPWPSSLLVAALTGLAEGRLGGNQRPYARAVGGRLTVDQYGELGRIATGFLELPQLTPVQRRAVRSLFVEIEKAGSDRIEIERAFDPALPRVFRITIPHV